MPGQIKSILKDRRGMAIVYVMMVVAVVTIAAVTMWQVTEHDMQKAEREEERSQAYYYAKSGVEIAVGMILNNLGSDEIALLDGVTYYGKLGSPVFTTTVPVDEKGREDYDVSFTINISSNEEEITYEVRSAGLSGSTRKSGSAASGNSLNTIGFEITHTRLVESVEGGQGGETADDVPPIVGNDLKARYAVFSKELIDLDSGSPVIVGDIGTNSGPVLLNYSSRILKEDGGKGSVYLGPGAKVHYPQWREEDWDEIGFNYELRFPPMPGLPAAPEVPAYPGLPDISDAGYSGDITSGRTVDLPSGSIKRFSKVQLGWNDVLTFVLHGDAVVFIDDLSSNGEIRLSGQGTLLMVVDGGINGSRTLINSGGDPSSLILYVKGAEIGLNSGGNGSEISGTVFAPNASINASYGTNITGDLVIGGDKLVFSGVSHNGTLYALNKDAEIEYSGNRDLVSNVYTLIYTNGSKLTVSSAHLHGAAYLTNPDARVVLGGSTTFSGNILTRGDRIDVSGDAALRGHIVAPDPDAEIFFTGGCDHEGAVITGGKTVSFSGGSVSVRGLLFAPEADFLLEGGAMIYGSVISRSFTASGGTSVTFEEIVYDDLPVVLEPTEMGSTEPNWRVFGRWIAN